MVLVVEFGEVDGQANVERPDSRGLCLNGQQHATTGGFIAGEQPSRDVSLVPLR